MLGVAPIAAPAAVAATTLSGAITTSTTHLYINKELMTVEAINLETNLQHGHGFFRLGLPDERWEWYWECTAPRIGDTINVKMPTRFHHGQAGQISRPSPFTSS